PALKVLERNSYHFRAQAGGKDALVWFGPLKLAQVDQLFGVLPAVDQIETPIARARRPSASRNLVLPEAAVVPAVEQSVDGGSGVAREVNESNFVIGKD